MKEKVRLATILGTLQSTLTNFRYLRKIWKTNADEERLLGISLTGIMDHPVLSGREVHAEVWPNEYDCVGLGDLLEKLKEVARSTNLEWAKILKIQPSLQLTLIKPSGTVSQLCSTSSGIHPRFSEYYMRRYTQDIKDPLTSLMIDQGIPYVARGEKIIFSFPVKSPEGSVTITDVGAISQLELWKIYQKYWCEGNPSQTIYYTDESFLDVQAWVWKNWDIVGGLSFFPLDDYIYDKEAQPYLKITEEEYSLASDLMPKSIEWDKLSEYEENDTTTSSQELSCQGGACEL